MKYSVMQSKQTNSGAGDYCSWGEFNNLKEARKLFNRIKKDDSGYYLDANHYLHTIILNNEIDYIVDSYELRK